MFSLTYKGKSFNQRETDSYINLGQLCSTHDKKLNHWSTNKSANAYLDAVSQVTGIPVTELIVVQHGVSTWGHPLVAIEVARWINPDFGVWCNLHIKTLMETGKTEIDSTIQSNAPSDPKNQVELACDVLDMVFKNVPIKPELVAGIKLNIAQKHIPELAPDLENARSFLATSTAQEFELLTATEIGKRIGLSAIKVNQKLIELGFQVKNENKKSKKDSSYLPTTKGSEFSDLTLSTGKGNDSTSYQQLRWYSSVISQF